MKVAMEMTMREKGGDKGKTVVGLWNGPASIFVRRLKTQRFDKHCCVCRLT